MNPVYEYSNHAPPILTGYRVSESVAVLVKELDQAGGAIAAVVSAGGNEVRVGDIRLRIGDPDRPWLLPVPRRWNRRPIRRRSTPPRPARILAR